MVPFPITLQKPGVVTEIIDSKMGLSRPSSAKDSYWHNQREFDCRPNTYTHANDTGSKPNHTDLSIVYMLSHALMIQPSLHKQSIWKWISLSSNCRRNSHCHSYCALFTCSTMLWWSSRCCTNNRFESWSLSHLIAAETATVTATVYCLHA